MHRIALHVTSLASLVLFSTATIVTAAGLAAQPVTARGWMSEEAMRADFAGETLDGHYGNGTTWTETYFPDGRIDYKENQRMALGRWSFSAGAFCTFYDPPFVPAFVGGCWQVLKLGPNCYEFYTAGARLPPQPGAQDDEDDAGARAMPLRWNARGWRTSQPSSCPEKPSV